MKNVGFGIIYNQGENSEKSVFSTIIFQLKLKIYTKLLLFYYLIENITQSFVHEKLYKQILVKDLRRDTTNGITYNYGSKWSQHRVLQ